MTDNKSTLGISLLLLCTLAVQLFFGYAASLAADEAYYWEWSRHLDWGYFDHPPMIAYVIAAGTRTVGATNLGVRVLPVLMFVGSVWLVYRLAWLYSKSARAALWAALLMVVTPLFSVGGLLATPDVPLVFFWMLSLLLALRALASQRLLDWIFAGAALGLGLLSKYHMVLMAVALLAALLSIRRGRQALRRPGPYLGALAAALLCIPMLIWNLERGMISVRFQLEHGLSENGADDFSPVESFFEFLAGQALVITPLLFGLVIWALVKAVKNRGRREIREQTKITPGAALVDFEMRPFLLYPAVLTLAMFSWASLHAETETNWAAPAYITAYVLLGPKLASLLSSASRTKRVFSWATVLIPAVLSAYMHVEAAFPILGYDSGPFAKVRDRRPLANWVQGLRDSTPGDPSQAQVLASNHKLASLLAFYLPDQPQTDSPFERGSGSAYAEWRGDVCQKGPAWYFSTGSSTKQVEELFDSYRKVGFFADRRRGILMEKVYAYYGERKPSGC